MCLRICPAASSNPYRQAEERLRDDAGMATAEPAGGATLAARAFFASVFFGAAFLGSTDIGDDFLYLSRQGPRCESVVALTLSVVDGGARHSRETSALRRT